MVSRLAVAGAPQSYFISHKNVKVQINNFENSFFCGSMIFIKKDFQKADRQSCCRACRTRRAGP